MRDVNHNDVTLRHNDVTHGIHWNLAAEFHDPSVDVVPPASLDLVVRRSATVVTRIRTPDTRRHGRQRHRRRRQRRRHRVDADARRDGSRVGQNL